MALIPENNTFCCSGFYNQALYHRGTINSSDRHPPKTLMDFFLNMINLGMNVVNVTGFKRFNFVNFVVPIIISLIESCC